MVSIYILIFIIGLIVGSFVNVLIYRIPKGEGVVLGRSKCPRCKKVLGWYDLVPLLSFAVLGGKCRNCGKKISWIYPVVELYSGIIFMVSVMLFAQFGLIYMIFSIFILEIFLILFMIDFKNLILPDSIIIAGLIGVTLLGALEYLKLLPGTLIIFSVDHFLAAAIFSLSIFSLWLVSRGRWIGLGDSKLMLLIGLVFGMLNGLGVLYLAIIIGTMVGLSLLLVKKADLKTKLPLGSFICLSASFYVYLGYDIIGKIGSIQPIFNIFK